MGDRDAKCYNPLLQLGCKKNTLKNTPQTNHLHSICTLTRFLWSVYIKWAEFTFNITHRQWQPAPHVLQDISPSQTEDDLPPRWDPRNCRQQHLLHAGVVLFWGGQLRIQILKSSFYKHLFRVKLQTPLWEKYNLRDSFPRSTKVEEEGKNKKKPLGGFSTCVC